MWLSQLERLENEYIVERTHIVGHNVCNNVVDLPDVLEIPGVEVFPFSNLIFYVTECCALYDSFSHGLVPGFHSITLSVD